MQQLQHVDAIDTFDVKDETRKRLERPDAQARYVELGGEARRARRRMTPEVAESLFERSDEPKAECFAALFGVLRRRILDAFRRRLSQ